MIDTNHFAVCVYRNGDLVVTIESNSLSGRDLLPGDDDTIRTAAHSLLGFIGEPAEREKGERVFQAVVYALEGKDVPDDLREHGMVRRARKERDEWIARFNKLPEIVQRAEERERLAALTEVHERLKAYTEHHLWCQSRFCSNCIGSDLDSLCYVHTNQENAFYHTFRPRKCTCGLDALLSPREGTPHRDSDGDHSSRIHTEEQFGGVQPNRGDKDA